MTEDLDMDWMTAQIIERTGVSAYVHKTRTGATIHVGTIDDYGLPPFAVGPGWVEGPNLTDARGDLEDFYWGDEEAGIIGESIPGDTPETVLEKIIQMMTELEVE